MPADKKLLISQVKLIRAFDETAVPTRIRYIDRQFKVGFEAESNARGSGRCYENFKVSLGRLTRQQAQTALESVSAKHRRSIVGITKDFFQGVISEAKANIEANGDTFPEKVLVAEPLSIDDEGQAGNQWLANYRANVRTALESWFEDVDFLPEPFAVFQYYRYGLRHPLLAEGQKHVALVLDFGGGTLDVSVIETTADGDISHGGKNSRPLSARSIPAAGFYINQRVAEDVLFSTLTNKESRSKARNIIKKVPSFQSLTDQDRSMLGEKELIFIDNFIDLLSQVERAKIRICNSISDWSLYANLHGSISHLIQITEDPFSEHGKKIEVPLRAERFREVFEKRVWDEKLKDAIDSAIVRAQRDLSGKPISVVLLSGGSTNIRWIKGLIERDLRNRLRDAEILEISENYQEVVAKGLAIECARQFFTEGDGDFGAVTYNRLNLGLRPDQKILEWRKFRPLEPGLPETGDEGTLLPSSTSLRAFLDKPMRWKARLGSAPKADLQYYYIKSSFDPSDLNSVHNVVDNVVRTPTGTSFGSSIEVELTVRHDGTAIPAFIYGRGRQETRVEGRPFYLDMTFADKEGARTTYLGFDFGTATSALSLVSNEHIQAYVHRSRDKAWLELGDLVQKLPYPVAHPLGMYITQTNPLQLEKYGLAALEAALTFIAFASMCDMNSSEMSIEYRGLFGNFRRSAGPLKHLLVELSKYVQEQTTLAKSLLGIIEDEVFESISEAVTQAAKSKHHKKADLDYNVVLGILGNHIQRAMQGKALGVFEGIEKKGFGRGYRGIFRCTDGQNGPFVRLFNYEGPVDFSSSEVFIADFSDGSIIPLSPLYIWSLEAHIGRQHGYDLYFADIVKQTEKRFLFTGVQQNEEIDLSKWRELDEIYNL